MHLIEQNYRSGKQFFRVINKKYATNENWRGKHPVVFVSENPYFCYYFKNGPDARYFILKSIRPLNIFNVYADKDYYRVLKILKNRYLKDYNSTKRNDILSLAQARENADYNLLERFNIISIIKKLGYDGFAVQEDAIQGNIGLFRPLKNKIRIEKIVNEFNFQPYLAKAKDTFHRPGVNYRFEKATKEMDEVGKWLKDHELEEGNLFDEIYYKCRLEPLFEQIYEETNETIENASEPIKNNRNDSIQIEKDLDNIKNKVRKILNNPAYAVDMNYIEYNHTNYKNIFDTIIDGKIGILSGNITTKEGCPQLFIQPFENKNPAFIGDPRYDQFEKLANKKQSKNNDRTTLLGALQQTLSEPLIKIYNKGVPGTNSPNDSVFYIKTFKRNEGEIPKNSKDPVQTVKCYVIIDNTGHFLLSVHRATIEYLIKKIESINSVELPELE